MRYNFIYNDIIMYWSTMEAQDLIVSTSLYNDSGHSPHSIVLPSLSRELYKSIETGIRDALERDMLLSPSAENHTTHISARRDSALTKV